MPPPPVRPLVIFRRCSAPVPSTQLHRASLFLYKTERVPVSCKTVVILCSDRVIRRLNARFRNVDRATDVLSFPFNDEDLLGEIYISPRRAAVQARKFGFTYRKEILRLFIHGFYHLLGYDHHAKKERKKMENKELAASAMIERPILILRKR